MKKINWKHVGVDFASGVDYSMEMVCEVKKSHIDIVDGKEIKVIDDMKVLYCTIIPRELTKNEKN